MDLDFLFPTIVAVVLILTTGGVAILRPLAKKGADLLEVMARERKEPKRLATPDSARMIELLEAMHARLERLEERQDFTDSLLGGEEGKALPRTRAETPRG